MAASIEDFGDSILQAALESRRQIFFKGFPASVSQEEKERQWNSYVFTLSRPSTSNPDTTSQHPTTERHAPSPHRTAFPETKKRRLNSDPLNRVPNLTVTTQYSLPHPSSHATTHEDGPSPFVQTEVPVATSSLRPQPTHGRLEQTQESNHNVAPLPISQRRGSSASHGRHVSVVEYAPGDLFGAGPQPMSARSSSMGQTYQPSSATVHSSSLHSSSPYSSFGGGSLGVSTSPTSVGMSRVDSTAGSSFQKGFDMLRVDSTKSPSSQHDPSMTSPLDSRQKLDFAPSQRMLGQPNDPVHDISQTGAQFANHAPSASAPAMQRQGSSSSRQLHPKQVIAPSMSRKSSATHHEIIRRPSEDGSIKEAIKISPASSYVRPTSEKVMCVYKGCTSQPNGFKGEHEMRRHFDRDHTAARRVWVCAPLAEDPTFLSKKNCKHCESQKRYNEDYNAGEHLRRMHFNPKKPKTRRGSLKPEEKRGGKGGGTEPPMSILRKYMFTYQVDSNNRQISDPQMVDPTSSVILPKSSASSQYSAEGVQALVTASSSSVVPQLKLSTEASNVSHDSDASHLTPSIERRGLDGNPGVADVSSGLEDPVFDQSPFDFNDPIFFESTQRDVPAPFDELNDFFSSLNSSSL